MEIKAVLFDLDGTLLPMNQDEFIQYYLKLLAIKLAPRGYESKKLLESMWLGVGAMVKNDGSKRNEDAFWDVFSMRHGEQSLDDKPFLEEFYKNEFHQAKVMCRQNPDAKAIVSSLRKKGKKVILATNPIFPAVATKSRMSWVGLSPEDFDFYTVYENSRFSKPNLKYYEEILEKIGCEPEECLMVGNDVSEDMVAEKLGMKVFLLTDCLINKQEEEISKYPHGDMNALKDFINEI